MAAYLERLRVLMEAGALGMLFPYGMQFQKNRSWVFFNRGYKPVGMRSGSWVEYAASSPPSPGGSGGGGDAESAPAGRLTGESAS